MERHLHIISLDIPYPPDYGGRFDIFYKMAALHAAGVSIHLHCFTTRSQEHPALHNWCEEVRYYRRNTGLKGISLRLPYIVSSRSNDELVRRLLEDDYPILMEGVHCTGLTLDRRLEKRRKIVRMHNVEFAYYRELARYSRSLFKKIYYLRESALLKAYERHLPQRVDAMLAITAKDGDWYNQLTKTRNIFHLPAFIPGWRIACKPGMGSFCLYHGKLSVDENEYAAIWLLRNVFSRVDIPLVIAGMNPSARLHRLARRYEHVCIVANPTEAEMQELVEKAQVHVLPSFNVTGIKIKLLNALYNGRHCVVNDATTAGTELESLCHTVKTAAAFSERLTQLYHQPFTEQDTSERQRVLYRLFDNKMNSEKLLRLLFE